MDKDKQIEEMAKMLYDYFGTMILTETDSEIISRYLYKIGYRKASDVAREIFAEIEENAVEHETFGLTLLMIGQRAFAELKKKYESEVQR